MTSFSDGLPQRSSRKQNSLLLLLALASLLVLAVRWETVEVK
jgi:hypothetical protein